MHRPAVVPPSVARRLPQAARRDFMLRLGSVGSALTVPTLLRAEAATSAANNASAVAALPRTSGRAKSCILIYLWGGPPQQDMWDLKPDAPEGIRSEFQPIDTVVPGLQ